MGDQKISLDSSITASVTRPATQKPFVPVIDPNEGSVLNRNKKMTLDELSQHYEKFTTLSGTVWDGSNKYLSLTSNQTLTFSGGSKQLGQLLVRQDGTGSRTLTINGTSFAINSAANSISVISAYYIDPLNGFVLFVGQSTLFITATVDTTAPTMVSATAINSTTVRVVFSESVTATKDGWSVYKTELSETAGASSVTGSGTTWDFTIGGTAMTSSHTLTISYNTGSGNTVDGAGNEVATISNASVTNSIGSSPVQLNAPTGVTLGTATTTTQPMTWTDTNSSPNENSYKVQQSPAGAGTWTDSTMTGLSSTGATVTGLTASTSYDYRVIAVGNGTTTSNSVPSSTVTGSTAAAGLDSDAAAYITAEETAASITIDTTNRNAISDLIAGFKSDGDWTGITDLMLGYGTGLKNARNLSSNATTTNSPTIGATGYSFNGSSNFLTSLNKDAISFGIYMRTNTADKAAFGTLDAGIGTYFFPSSSGSAATRIKASGDASTANASPAPAIYVLTERASGPVVRVTKNDTQIISTSVTVSGASTVPMMLGCFNNAGSPVSYNACEIGLYVAGTSEWDNAAMTRIYNRISAFITATSRT